MIIYGVDGLTKFYILKNTLLNAVDIHKSFGTLEVLKGIDITVYESEIVAIMGKSGSGKSTLLQILGTLDNPDKGTIEIDKLDITTLKSQEIARFRNDKIGFIFQFHHLLNEFTALENVLIPAYIGQTNSKLTNDKAKELLDYLGLSERLDHKPGQLSGGEQQRVAVARALAPRPKILIADEPTGNLDSETGQQISELIFKKQKERGMTFVLVTHDESLAKACDRTINVNSGVVNSEAVPVKKPIKRGAKKVA